MNTGRPASHHARSGGNACIVLAYSAGGAALMNAWLFIVHAHPLVHFVTTLPWLSTAALSVLRIRRALPEGDDASVPRTPAPRAAGACWPIALLGTGAGIGVLVAACSAIPLGLVAVGLGFAPWYRIGFCRRRPVWTSLLMAGGGALALGGCWHRVEFMFLPVAAWIFGMASLLALLAAAPKRLPAQRPARPGPLPLQP